MTDRAMKMDPLCDGCGSPIEEECRTLCATCGAHPFEPLFFAPHLCHDCGEERHHPWHQEAP